MSTKDLSKTAYDHLWMHFTRMSSYENSPVPTIVRGEGTHISVSYTHLTLPTILLV